MQKPVTWLDFIFPTKTVAGDFVVAAVIGLAVYLLAIGPLIASGQSNLIKEPALIFAGVGVAYTVLSCRYLSRGYYSRIIGVRDVIANPDTAIFDQKATEHIKRTSAFFGRVVITLVVWIVLNAALYGTIYGYSFPAFLSGLYVFSAPWYLDNPGRPWRLATIGIATFPCLLVLETTAHALLSHTIFLLQISRLSYLPALGAVLQRLDPLLRTGVLASFAWSSGLTFFILLWGVNTFTFVQILFCGLVALIGGAGFAIPVLSMRHAFESARKDKINLLTDLALEAGAAPNALEREKILAPLEMQLETYRKRIPIYGGGFNLLSFATSSLIPLAAAVLKPTIVDFVQTLLP